MNVTKLSLHDLRAEIQKRDLKRSFLNDPKVFNKLKPTEQQLILRANLTGWLNLQDFLKECDIDHLDILRKLIKMAVKCEAKEYVTERIFERFARIETSRLRLELGLD